MAVGAIQAMLEQAGAVYTTITAADDLSRARLWYLFSRCVCVVAAWSFFTNLMQIRAICGQYGVMPAWRLLTAMKRDFPSWRRFAYLPTLLWLNHSDTAMLCYLASGGLIMLYGAVFGPQWWMFGVAYILLLTFIIPANITWPWDNFLTETLIHCMFLPCSPVVPPSGLVCFAFRWLTFRLMHGFGKIKFTGQHPKNDKFYLKNFYTFQPMPGLISWYLQSYLPDSIHRSSMIFFWLAEVPAPFLFLCWGRLRLIGAAFTILLQLGIQTTGNFGYFNVLTIVNCLPAFDIHTSLTSGYASAADANWSWLHPFIWFVFPFSLLTVNLNSWVNNGWSYMPQLEAVFGRLQAVVRVVQPFYMVSAYGVFPPHLFPKERCVPVIEGSMDRVTWKEYEYTYISTNEYSRPPLLCAPYHPRMEYMTVYCGTGLWDGVLSLMGNPYIVMNTSYHQRWAARLLYPGPNTQPLRDVFKVNPFPDPNHPPKYTRVRCYMLAPSPGNGNKYWRRTFLSTHAKTMSLDDPFVQAMFAPENITRPDEWYVELPVWRQRFKAEPANQLLWKQVQAMDESVIPKWFWTDFVNEFHPPAEPTDQTPLNPYAWSSFISEEHVRFLRTFPDAAKRREVQTIAGRVIWLLEDALTAPTVKAEIKKILGYHAFLMLLAQTLLGSGRDRIQSYLADPTLLIDIARKTSFERCWYYFTLFDYERMVWQGAKARLASSIAVADLPLRHAPMMPGFLATSLQEWNRSLFKYDPNRTYRPADVPYGTPLMAGVDHEEEYEYVPSFTYDERGMDLVPASEPLATLPVCYWTDEHHKEVMSDPPKPPNPFFVDYEQTKVHYRPVKMDG